MVTETQARMDTALRAAEIYRVPPYLVMPCDMLNNWERRMKRLDRALIVNHLDPARKTAIRAARERLRTGRLHP